MNNTLQAIAAHWNQKTSLETIRQRAGESQLKRTLGVFDLVLLGLGVIIGAGIFVVTGFAAAKYAGPAIVLSFIMAAVVCTFTALTYSELAALIPTSGGAYTFAMVGAGQLIGTLVGWLNLGFYVLAAAIVSVGWSGYMTGFLGSMGLILPEALTRAYFDGGTINLPAVFIVLSVAAVSFHGTSMISKFNSVLVLVKICSILTFVFLSAPYIEPSNWEPFMPYGWSGVFTGTGVVFLAFGGFDALATASEECKNPNRDLPWGIVLSVVISALFYIMVSLCLTGICNYKLLDSAQPIAFALYQKGITFGGKLVSAGALTGLTTVVLTLIFGVARIVMVMSREGILPHSLSYIHPKHQTPSRGIFLAAVIVATLAGLLPVSKLGEMVSLCCLSVFCTVAILMIRIRFMYPHAKRNFQCPMPFIVAPISAFMSGFLAIKLLASNLLGFTLMLGSGFILYIGYSVHNIGKKK